MNFLKKIKDFLKEVKTEVKKVSWPGKQQTLKYTLLVIGISAVTAAFLGGLDYLLSALLKKFIL